ncbi:4-hydroxythreonine-4-phosphate dehydrogenase PdxA [Rudanella lutea]|uniref:4-hydroxythreonine-4-phosphate dehydrogenase PdxA n=1 Tax=Rudanella lutea TaxID=451374 RepID=UPI0003732D90
MEERQPEKRNDRNNDRRNRNRHRNRGNRSGGPREDRTPSTKPEEIMAYVDDEPGDNTTGPVNRTPAGETETGPAPRSENPRPERPNNRSEGNRNQRQNDRQDAGRSEGNRPEGGRQEGNRQDTGRPDAGRPDAGRQNGGGRDHENRSEGGRQEGRQQQQPNGRDRDRNRDRNRDRDREQREPERERPAREEPLIQEWTREDELRPSDLRPGESRMGERKISDLAGRGADVAPEDRLVVGISLGDYNGIGPEVILKALKYNQMQRLCTVVIYGSMRVLNRYRNLLNLKDWNLNGIQHVGQASHKMTNVITCWNDSGRPNPAPAPQPGSATETPAGEPQPVSVAGEQPALEASADGATADVVAADVATADVVTAAQTETVPAPTPVPSAGAAPGPAVYEIQPGKVTPEAGQAAFACLQRAVDDLKAGKLDALVTGPINKHNMQSDAFKFPGHTEYLAEAFGVPDDLMFMVGESLRVGVVTGHVPLGRVRQNVTRNAISQKLTMMMQSLRQDFGIAKPRIAVLGLNPHAGENGLLGNEETETISPVIEDWRKKGELVYGPFPADGFFGTRSYRKYDAVLAMYHDQGLIPFKAIAFEEGVNFTAGLPIVRTSPDHGTAYDIAGKNVADETSMIQAIYLACDVARRRKEYKETEANALKK